MTQFTGRRIAAAALLTAATSLAGCEGAEMEINGQKGVPLADVVLTGTPPSEVVLASGDTVILTEGDQFSIKVEGGNTESLRFVRDERTIGITREEGWSGETNAIIRITMPAPEEVVIAGSGTIKAPTLASGPLATASVQTAQRRLVVEQERRVTEHGVCQLLEALYLLECGLKAAPGFEQVAARNVPQQIDAAEENFIPLLQVFGGNTGVGLVHRQHDLFEMAQLALELVSLPHDGVHLPRFGVLQHLPLTPLQPTQRY